MECTSKYIQRVSDDNESYYNLCYQKEEIYKVHALFMGQQELVEVGEYRERKREKYGLQQEGE